MKNQATLLYHQPLTPDSYFHIYNRTNGKEPLFRSVSDYHNFLAGLKEYVFPFVDILSFNLMYNHFHLVIKTLSKKELHRRSAFGTINKLPQVCQTLMDSIEENVPLILSNRFGAFFNTYAQQFNYRHGREGNLFHRRFCRKLIHTNEYAEQCIYYVNTNGIKHAICETLETDTWSSYNAICNGQTHLLNTDLLYNIFGGAKSFHAYHQKEHKYSSEPYIIEIEDN